MQKSFRSLDVDVTVSNLSNPSLDRRLHSMKELRLCIDWMERQEEYDRTQKSALSYLSSVVSGSDISPPPPLPVTTPFITQQVLQSPSHFTDFLLQRSIVEVAFTASTSHVEVMRRMDRVLRWLVTHSALTDEHIHLLWSLTVSEKHESVEHLLYELMGKLAPLLSPHHLSLLLSFIAKVPTQNVDVHLCHLIKKLSHAQFQHTAQLLPTPPTPDKSTGETQTPARGDPLDQSDGLELLWRLMQLAPSPSSAEAGPGGEGGGKGGEVEGKDEVVVSPDVQTRAERYFLDLLSSDVAVPLRRVFIDRLVACIVSGHRVSTSMQVLEKIVQTYQQGGDKRWFGRKGEMTPAAVIESMEAKYHLIAMTIKEIVAYHTRYLALIQAESPHIEMPQKSVEVTSPLVFAYVDGSKVRQSFLVSLLSHSPLQLTRSQIDTLWTTLIEHAITQDEQEFALCWMTDGCTVGVEGFAVLTDDLCAYLLQHKVLMMPAVDFTLAAFRLLYRLFTHVHVRAGHIKLDEAFVLSADQQQNEWMWEKEEEEREQMAAHQLTQAAAHITTPPSHDEGSMEERPMLLLSEVTSTPAVEGPPSALVSSVLLSLPPDTSSPPSSHTNGHGGGHSPSPRSGSHIRPRSRTNSVSSVGSSSSSSSVDSASSSSLTASSSAPSTASPSPLMALGRELSVLDYSALEDIVRALWEIGLKNPSQLVGQKAVLILNKIHQNLNTKNKVSDAKVKDDHLRRCLNALSVALLVPTDRQDDRTRRLISRCVYTLNTYLQGVSSSSSTSPTPLVLRIVPTRELRCAPFDVPYIAKSGIGDLRRLVFEHLEPYNPGLTLHAVEMSWNDKKLLSNHVQLGSIPFMKADSILVRRFSDSFTLFHPVAGYTTEELAIACSQSILTFDQLARVDTRPPPPDKGALFSSQSRKRQLNDPSLSSIAADATSFERLFSLLSPGNAVSQDIWEVLMLLPTNNSYCRRFLSLDGVSVDSWSKLLDPASVYRLVYSLQVIDDILHSRLSEEFSKSFDRQARLNWCQEFIRRGGLHHLINVMTTSSFVTYDITRHGDKCIYYLALELLFRLVTDFFSLDPAFPISSSIVVDHGLQRGRITQHPAFDALVQKTVMEGIIHSIMQTEADSGGLHAGEGQGGAGDHGESGNAGTAGDLHNGHLMELHSIPSSGSAQSLATARSEMIHSALLLLAGCVCCRPALMPQILSHSSFPSLLTLLLLVSPDEKTRVHSAKTVGILVRQAAKVSMGCRGSTVSAVLSLVLSPVLSDYQQHSAQCFGLCRDVVDETFNIQPQTSDQFIAELRGICNHLFRFLQRHDSGERDDAVNVIDELLVGSIQFITQIIRTGLMTAVPAPPPASPRDTAAPSFSSWCEAFTHFLYTACLFANPDTRVGGCACKSTVSRAVAYCALLTCASQSQPSHALLCSLLSSDPMWHVNREPCGWRYEPYLLDKEADIHAVGLKNQGSTCYMNSFLQQLFMVPTFRNAVLTARTDMSEAEAERIEARSGGAALEAAAVTPSPPGSPASSKSGLALPVCSLARSNSTPAVLFSPASTRARLLAAGSSYQPQSPAVSTNPQGPTSVGLPVKDDSSSGSTPVSSLLSHLQHMFIHLQLSRKSFYDTAAFCESLRDASGLPVNLSEQKDVNEFAGQIFDQLDTEAQLFNAAAAPTVNPSASPSASSAPTGPTPSLSPLLQPFRGVLLNQMLSRECTHTSEREEPFYMLSLTVKNKQNLSQALDLFVEGDLLDGENKWQCNVCQEKRAALKRCCLSGLPSYLILHLKRFEFDFDVMKKMKINEYFSFPLELNLFPYTKEGLHDQQREGGEGGGAVSPVPPLSPYDYRLCGILIHSGVADAGHYYSYVRVDNKGGGEDCWLELNDETVTPFDPSKIPQAAFGGTDPTPPTPGQSRLPIRENMRNAYMLLYQRVFASASTSHLYPHDTHHPTPATTLSALSNPPSVPSSPIGSPRPSTAGPRPSSSHLTAKDPLGDSRTLTPEAPDEDLNTRYPLSSLSTPQSLRIHTGHALSPPLLSPSPFASSPVRARAQQLWLRSFPSLPPASALPSTLVSGIWKANVAFLQDKQIFDFSFLSFCFHLCTRQSPPPSKSADHPHPLPPTNGTIKPKPLPLDVQLTQISTFFTFKILARSAENGTLYQWVELLKSQVRGSVGGRKWLLGYVVQEADFTQQMMFLCPHAVVRDAFCDLLFLLIHTQAASDLHGATAQRQMQRRMSAEAAKEVGGVKTEADQHSAERRGITHPALASVTPLLSLLLSWLPYVPSQARTSAAYFRLFLRLVQRRPSIRRWFIKEGAISLLLHFYCTTRPILHFNYRNYASAGPHRGGGRDDSSSSLPSRLFHPYRGHLALSVLALLVSGAMKKRGQGKARHKSVKEAFKASDRQLLLHGLLPDEEELKAAAALKEAKEKAEVKDVKIEVKDINKAEAKEDGIEEKVVPPSTTEGKDEEKVAAEEEPHSAPADSAEKDPTPVPASAPSTPAVTPSPAPSPTAAVSSLSPSPAPTPSAPPTSSVSATFPFFPFVLSDSSCLSVVCSLVQSLAWEDASITRGLFDCIFDLLHDLINALPTRVMQGIHVHHQPLQSEPPLSSSTNSQSPSASLCRVSDFLTPFGAFATLLTLPDSLHPARVDLGLTRLFVLIRRVLARRHGMTGGGAGGGGVSGVVNGNEERFMLVAVRCLLRLSVTARAVAHWLKAHDKEWLAWEALYTNSRQNVMAHHIR